MINFPLKVKAFIKTEVFPIQDHYYNPQFVYSKKYANKIRNLYLNFNLDKQIAELSQLKFTNELTFKKEVDPYQGECLFKQ